MYRTLFYGQTWILRKCFPQGSSVTQGLRKGNKKMSRIATFRIIDSRIILHVCEASKNLRQDHLHWLNEIKFKDTKFHK